MPALATPHTIKSNSNGHFSATALDDWVVDSAVGSKEILQRDIEGKTTIRSYLPTSTTPSSYTPPTHFAASRYKYPRALWLM